MIKRLSTLIILFLCSFLMVQESPAPILIIEYNTLGGSHVPSFTGTRDTFFYAPIPFKEDFLFEGWYCDPLLVIRLDDSCIKNDTLDLYAKWEAINPFDLVFHMTHTPLDNGTIESKLYMNGTVFVHGYDIEITYDETVQLLRVESLLNQVINETLENRIRFNYVDIIEGINEPMMLIKIITTHDLDLEKVFKVTFNGVYRYQDHVIESVNYRYE